jgi:hypothetical protein
VAGAPSAAAVPTAWWARGACAGPTCVVAAWCRLAPTVPTAAVLVHRVADAVVEVAPLTALQRVTGHAGPWAPTPPGLCWHAVGGEGWVPAAVLACTTSELTGLQQPLPAAARERLWCACGTTTTLSVAQGLLALAFLQTESAEWPAATAFWRTVRRRHALTAATRGWTHPLTAGGVEGAGGWVGG